MRKKTVKKSISKLETDNKYLDDLYLEKDELIAELYNAEEKGFSTENIANIGQQIREIEKKIEIEEIAQLQLQK